MPRSRTRGRVASYLSSAPVPGLTVIIIISIVFALLRRRTACRTCKVHDGLQAQRGRRYCLFAYSGKRLAQLAYTSVPRSFILSAPRASCPTSSSKEPVNTSSLNKTLGEDGCLHFRRLMSQSKVFSLVTAILPSTSLTGVSPRNQCCTTTAPTFSNAYPADGPAKDASRKPISAYLPQGLHRNTDEFLIHPHPVRGTVASRPSKDSWFAFLM
ncbi:hypothetical protein LZ30DRAFT_45257 [Colletotrichum cereale]|nr:hypothetical protein LZ30DRAFT_45257 [Colletotrichum cereale]